MRFARADTRYARKRRERRRRVVYSPGCGGCYLNRNRNSRSVLGIGYAIARVRAAHMNQISDGQRLSYHGGEGGEAKEKEACRFVIDFFDVRENKSSLCTRTREMCIADDGGEIAKPQKRIENRATRLPLL